MPIEVKELIITAVVRPNEANHHRPESPQEPDQDDASGKMGDREDIIAECVEQVLEIIRKKIER